MPNGSRDLNRATENEKTIATALIAVAAAIFAGVFAFWPAVLANLSHTGVNLANIIIILGLVALTISMIFGGRGLAYGPKKADWRDRFNLQAVFGVAALLLFILVGIIAFATSEPSPNEKFAAKQTELETRLKDLNDKVDKNQTDLSAAIKDLKTTITGMSADISDSANKEQKRLGDLDRSSTDQAGKLHDIEDGFRSLSNRIEQLEKNAAPAKQ